MPRQLERFLDPRGIEVILHLVEPSRVSEFSCELEGLFEIHARIMILAIARDYAQPIVTD